MELWGYGFLYYGVLTLPIRVLTLGGKRPALIFKTLYCKNFKVLIDLAGNSKFNV